MTLSEPSILKYGANNLLLTGTRCLRKELANESL
jgi:hypothetical protein